MQRVPLVGAGKAVLKPVPLRDRGLYQAGGGVCVVFEELDRGAVVGQIEPAVKSGRFTVPCGADSSTSRSGDPHLSEPVLIENDVARGQCQALNLVGRSFKPVDFRRTELPVGGLIPVRSAVCQRMVGEPDALNAHLPIVARGDG